MGKPKAKVPKMLSIKDSRITQSQSKKANEDRMKLYRKKKAKLEAAGKDIRKLKKKDEGDLVRAHPTISSTTMFFTYNTSLGPPFYIICDTNFISFSIKNRIDMEKAMMDCLLAKCVPLVTDCIVAELEKLGSKYRLALRMIKTNCERLTCIHRGTYADDCIVNRVTEHKCYIVATCDKDLKRRIRKIPGVPIMAIRQKGYTIERMPDAYGCTK